MTRLGLMVAMMAGLAVNVAAKDAGPVCDDWSRVASPNTGKINTLTAIDARDAANVWAVGREWPADGTREGMPLVVRWDNTSWAVEPLPDLTHLGYSPRLEAIHVGSTGEPWVVGRLRDATGQHNNALILQWQGGFWQAHQVVMLNSFAPRYPALRDVTALSAGAAWAVGDAQTMVKGVVEPFAAHWDGSSWTEVPVPAAFGRNRTISAVTAAAGGAVWAVGHDLDGDNIKTANPRIFRFNGTEWEVIAHPAADKPAAVLHDIVAIAANDIWAVGVVGDDQGGFFLHWDGQAWTSHHAPVGANPRSADGVASNNVWAAGSQGLSHWDGVSWTLRPSTHSDLGAQRVAVSVSGPCDAWMVSSTDDPAGATIIQRLDATSPTPPPTALPNTPVAFVASPRSIKEIALQWQSGGDSTLPADQEWYVIERCIGGGGDCATRFETLAKVVGGTTSFVDSGLEPGASYTYRIYAENAVGRSAATVPVTATTFNEEGEPSPLPVPENIPSGNTGTTTFDDVPSAEAEPVPPVEAPPSVEVEPVPTVESSPIPEAEPVKPESGAEPVTTDGSRTAVEIVPVDDGSRPAPGARPGSRPSRPATPTGLVTKSVSETEIALAWDSVTEPHGARNTIVVIERCVTDGESCFNRFEVVAKVLAATSFLDSGLQPATTYTYRVYAVNDYGESDPSKPVVGSTVAPETSPLPIPVPESGAETVPVL